MCQSGSWQDTESNLEVSEARNEGRCTEVWVGLKSATRRVEALGP